DDADDVRVHHRRRRLRLAREPREPHAALGLHERLEREVLAVRRALHLVDRAHAALAEAAHDLVATAEHRADRQRADARAREPTDAPERLREPRAALADLQAQLVVEVRDL